MSGRMAFSVAAVSIRVSPFLTLELPTGMFITSAPSRLPASSNEDCVRVEASKNRLIWVRPRSVVRFFSTWREISTAESARSSNASISSRDSPSMPSRWRREKIGLGAGLDIGLGYRVERTDEQGWRHAWRERTHGFGARALWDAPPSFQPLGRQTTHVFQP